MKLVTEKEEKLFKKYPTGSQAEEEDPLCIVKYFNPYGRGTWYVMEAEQYNDDMIFFGYVESPINPLFDELGTFSLKELSELQIPIRIGKTVCGYGKIERDMYFDPVRLSEITE